MRQIKFRGIRVDNGQFIYGELIHNSFLESTIYDKIDKFHVYPDSVAQFVGYDKYMREVYEGDTVVYEKNKLSGTVRLQSVTQDENGRFGLLPYPSDFKLMEEGNAYTNT